MGEIELILLKFYREKMVQFVKEHNHGAKVLNSKEMVEGLLAIKELVVLGECLYLKGLPCKDCEPNRCAYCCVKLSKREAK